MRFIKLKFRKADIFLIPLMCLVMFLVQYYALKSQAQKQDKKLSERLEKLAKECRNGNDKSCEEYRLLYQKITP